MNRRVGSMLVVAMAALSGCGSSEPSGGIGVAGVTTTVAESTTSAAPAGTGVTATIAAPDDGPFAGLPDDPITVVAFDGSVRTLDPASGATVEELVPAVADGAVRVTDATQDPAGDWYVTTVGSTGGCDSTIHQLVDGRLEEFRPGRSPVFGHDGTRLAYTADGYARDGLPQPLSTCFYDTIVVEDLVAGTEQVWRLELPEDMDPTDEFAAEDFYQLGGTPGALEFSPDSAILAFGIFGEGFSTHTLDLSPTAAGLESKPLTVSDEAAAALDAALPNGYGLTSAGWAEDGSLDVIAFSYNWPGWAEAVAVDGAVTEVISTSSDPIESGPEASRDGFDLVIDRTDDASRLVVVAPDGTERELAASVRSASW